MLIDSEQLPRHLQRDLGPLYTVFGDEPLLVLEAADRIRAAARARGHTEREVLIAEAGFDWQRLWMSGVSLSLFATKRVLDVRIPNGAPGVAGGEAIAKLAADLPPDTLTLVTLPKLDRRTRDSRWFTALEAAGPVVQAQRVMPEALPAWLAGRLRQQDQEADADTLQFLADRVEGNLLAAHQEVQKLALLFPAGRLEPEAVRGAVLDVARYEVFDLGATLLKGDAVRFVRMLDGLRAEGEGLPLVLWTIAEEARGLLEVQLAVAAGKPSSQAMRDARVWGDRQRLMPQALRRLAPSALRAALQHAARIDRIIKGVAPGDPWDELRLLGLSLAVPGRMPLAPAA